MSDIVGHLERGDRLLVVQATTWQGEPRLDLRWWAWIEEQWRPTRAGVSMTPEEFREIMGILALAWRRLFPEEATAPVDDGEGDGEALLERLLGGLAGEEEAV